MKTELLEKNCIPKHLRIRLLLQQLEFYKALEGAEKTKSTS